MYIYIYACMYMHTYVMMSACNVEVRPLHHRAAVTSQQSSTSSVVIVWTSRGLPTPRTPVHVLASPRGSKADRFRESVGAGGAPPLSSAYFTGSTSFNHSSCAGYINSV